MYRIGISCKIYVFVAASDAFVAVRYNIAAVKYVFAVVYYC